MRAWIVVATVLLVVCDFGCRQVNTLGPSGDSLSVHRSQSLPEGERPIYWGVSSVANTHQELANNYQVVEVCRIPTDEAGVYRSTVPNEIADETVPVNCNLTEFLGTMEPLSCGECDTLPPNFGDATKGFAELATEHGDRSASRPFSCDGAEDRNPRSPLSEILTTTRDNVCQDYSNYYTRDTLGKFIVILAPAAVFANSSIDANVGNWYQQHVRSASTNHAADFFRPLGDGFYTMPVYVSAKLLGEYFDNRPGMALLGEFGDRTTRAFLVGAPPLLAVQYLTGGDRPSSFADQSYWKPFHSSHGASGHAFIGALPFLTLAGMTDDPLAKCFFYACSPWTGFSRINDNVHYLSQVWLGWWMAYLACDAVNKTEKGNGPLLITPLCTPEMTGVGLIYQH